MKTGHNVEPQFDLGEFDLGKVMEEHERRRETIPFITESNRIEGITREPSTAEIHEHNRFMELKEVTRGDMIAFVNVFQPGAKLRVRAGMDVRVGNHLPLKGSIQVADTLDYILHRANSGNYSAYSIHRQYEKLHPFMDGNGRSGRMLWLWMMRSAPLGFLHTWYYQSLDAR